MKKTNVLFLIFISLIFLACCDEVDDFLSAEKKELEKKAHVKNKAVATKAKTRINSLQSFESFVKDGQEKGYFPRKILGYNGYRGVAKLKEVNFKFRNILHWDINSKCNQHEENIILALDNQNHSIVCPSEDLLVISGDGDDEVKVPWRNGVYLMGKGDDRLDVSNGSNIFVFEKNWGHDKIRCTPQVANAQKIVGYDGTYPYKYNSFLIFADGIKKKDLRWMGNTLLHVETNDTIELSSRNFNLLFKDDKNPSLTDSNFIQEIYQKKNIKLDKLKAEQIIQHEGLFYLSQRYFGVDIARLKDGDLQVFKNIYLPFSVYKIFIKDDKLFAILRHASKGSVAIVDIKSPLNAKLLTIIDFKDFVKSLHVDEKKRLFIVSSPDSKFDDRLHIYDVANPSNPKPLSELNIGRMVWKVKSFGDTLLMNNFQTGFTSMNVTEPKKPVQTDGSLEKGNSVENIFKVNDDTFFASYYRGALAKFKIFQSRARKVCDINLSKQKDMLSHEIDGMRVKNHLLFVAAHKEGVKVVDMEKCELIDTIEVDGVWVSKMMILQNQLIIFSNQTKIISLDKYFPEDSTRPKLALEPKAKLHEDAKKHYALLGKDRLQSKLEKAAYDDNATLVKILCDLGADPYLEGHSNYSPLERAAMLGRVKALDALVKCSKNIGENTALYSAAMQNRYEAIKILVENGFDINKRGDGCTPLHSLAADGDVE